MSIYEERKKKIEFKDILWIDNDSEFAVGRLLFSSPKIDHSFSDLSEHYILFVSFFFSVNLSVNHVSIKVLALE